jgi:predicted component of type VI protein secretion system
MVVGWLVRAQGPGRRGETLRLAEGRTQIGRDPACQVNLGEDPAVVSQHAEISASNDRFVVRPVAGPITVEGAAVSTDRVLLDGDTIGIGGGLYVFKSATAGNLLARGPGEAGEGPTRTRPARRRRSAGADSDLP